MPFQKPKTTSNGKLSRKETHYFNTQLRKLIRHFMNLFPSFFRVIFSSKRTSVNENSVTKMAILFIFFLSSVLALK